MASCHVNSEHTADHSTTENKPREKRKFVFDLALWSDCRSYIQEEVFGKCFSGSFPLLSLSEVIKAAGSTFMQQKTRQIFRPIFCLLDKAYNKPVMTEPAIICQYDPAATIMTSQ